jgi:hypothetical protein
MANPKGKKQKRQAERKRQLRLEAAARHAASTAPTAHSSPSYSGMPSPFCMRGASNTTSSLNHRRTAHLAHVNQLSFSAGGSYHVQLVSGVGVLIWSQHA